MSATSAIRLVNYMNARTAYQRLSSLTAAVQRMLPTRLLALEWDAREARFVAATATAAGLTIEHAVRVPLPPAAEEETGLQAAHAELIQAALNIHRVGRGRLLVGVQRSSVDLRQLTAPAVSAVELPDLVRHQAARELTAMQEGAVLDFVPLAADGQDMSSVLAAALPSEGLAACTALCGHLKRTPQRMTLRPLAAASLWRRQNPDDQRICLLIDFAPDEADLTVVRGGEVIFSRAARLPAEGGDEESAAPLLTEIRRTLMAVTNQPGGDKVEAIFVYGGPEEHSELLSRIADDSGLTVATCDPLAGVALSDDLSRLLPESRGRFAAAVGMLLDEAAGRLPELDFLHPRRPPAAPNQGRRYAAVAASAAALALGGVAIEGWQERRGLDAEVRRLTKESNQRDEELKKAQAAEEAAAAIEQWTGGEVVWLDELRDLSARFPKRRDAVLLRLSMGRAPSGGGQMDLQGLVRDPSIVGRMEGNLRDDHHEVRSKRVQENIREKTFTWQFESSLSVQPRTSQEYRSAVDRDAVPATGPTAGGALGPRGLDPRGLDTAAETASRGAASGS